MRKEELLKSLATRSQLANSSKLNKILRLPLKVVLSKFIDSFKLTYPVVAETFWGGKMNVVLPEVVSAQIYRYGYFDQEVCHYIVDSLKEGETFMDIGSHFGGFSLLASSIVGKNGRVIAIDPTPSTFNLMVKNLSNYAAFQNFQTFNIALYDKDCKIPFYDFGVSESAYNSIIGSRNRVINDAEKYKIEIQARTLDNLVSEMKLDRVDFLKIDAESAELAILKGGKETLQKFAPKLTVEIGDTGLQNAPKTIEVISFLVGLGYKAYEWQNGKIVPHQTRESYDKHLLSCYNLLFVK